MSMADVPMNRRTYKLTEYCHSVKKIYLTAHGKMNTEWASLCESEDERHKGRQTSFNDRRICCEIADHCSCCCNRQTIHWTHAVAMATNDAAQVNRALTTRAYNTVLSRSQHQEFAISVRSSCSMTERNRLDRRAKLLFLPSQPCC